MMEKKYHEIYGYLSQDEIDRLSETERCHLFLDWLSREPTAEGWIITLHMINQLGEEFIKYITRNVIKLMEEENERITEMAVNEEMMDMLTEFATDQALLYALIDDYKKECPDVESHPLMEIVES